MTTTILRGDCRAVLPTLAAASVHCVVTSPPYFGLRSYLPEGHPDKHLEIGAEPTPDEYVAEMVAVFREVWRVLRDDGTLWLNIGDSYAAGGMGPGSGKQLTNVGANMPAKKAPPGYKPKDLLGIPWLLAFALRADGWYLRSDIIWAKPNPMPESVRDRPTSAHEHVFLLSKRGVYFYDAAAIAEDAADPDRKGGLDFYPARAQAMGRAASGNELAGPKAGSRTDTRNARNVWSIATQPFSGAHFATMPPDLAERCILASTSEHGACCTCGAPWARMVERTAMVLRRSERTHDKGRTRTSGTMVSPPTSRTTGWAPTCDCPVAYPLARCVVLDPFGGAGTTGLVADRLQRDALLIELNPEYRDQATDRLRGDAPLLAQVR